MFYHVLNIYFFVIHTSIVIFNLVGWGFKKTRKFHLGLQIITLFSWFIIGAWYGWGYCFCTDWHWDVREKMGFKDESTSYIHFLFLKITGINAPVALVDQVTLITLLICFLLSVWLNIRDFRIQQMNRLH